jgi:cobalt-zinc-cadmium efflux system protein
VAFLGLIVNILVAWMLSRNNHSLNTKAALVHVMGDLLGSIAALIAGIVIQYTGWMEIDPILSRCSCAINKIDNLYFGRVLSFSDEGRA